MRFFFRFLHTVLVVLIKIVSLLLCISLIILLVRGKIKKKQFLLFSLKIIILKVLPHSSKCLAFHHLYLMNKLEKNRLFFKMIILKVVSRRSTWFQYCSKFLVLYHMRSSWINGEKRHFSVLLRLFKFWCVVNVAVAIFTSSKIIALLRVEFYPN